jgi:hypothetical protein
MTDLYEVQRQNSTSGCTSHVSNARFRLSEGVTIAQQAVFFFR